MAGDSRLVALYSVQLAVYLVIGLCFVSGGEVAEVGDGEEFQLFSKLSNAQMVELGPGQSPDSGFYISGNDGAAKLTALAEDQGK